MSLVVCTPFFRPEEGACNTTQTLTKRSKRGVAHGFLKTDNADRFDLKFESAGLLVAQ